MAVEHQPPTPGAQWACRNPSPSLRVDEDEATHVEVFVWVLGLRAHAACGAEARNDTDARVAERPRLPPVR